MEKITAFFMSAIFVIMSFLGIPFEASDLEKTELNPAVATEESITLFKNIYETETKWLASLQLENGAIPMTGEKNGDIRMNPYFADFAALALLDNAEEYADEVKAYADWHFAHLNTAKEDFNGLDGTVYDYVITVKDGKVAGEKASQPEGGDSYDSTDSYAASFLQVLSKYMQKTGDIAYISANAKDIERIAAVMTATLHKGLTYAKPNHKVKYLMDNCEVYQGAVAAAELFSELTLSGEGDFSELSEKYDGFAATVKDTINKKLWNFAGKNYIPEMDILGVPTKIFYWQYYYPCATAQLFPIASGIIDPDTQRAEYLYGKFCENYEWEKFDIPDDFYWGANVYTAAVMNDLDRVVTYMTEYSKLLEKHAWPLYNADSARVSMAAYIMLERAGAV